MSNVRVLLVKEAREYVHQSTTAVVECVKELASTLGWSVTVASSKLAEFDDGSMLASSFDVILLAHCSGNIFSAQQLDSLLRFSTIGAHDGRVRGIVGLHSALATHLEDDQFRAIFGARFIGHPVVQVSGRACKVFVSNTC